MWPGSSVVGEPSRNLKQHGFEEGVSTRLLIYTGELIAGGIAPPRRRGRDCQRNF